MQVVVVIAILLGIAAAGAAMFLLRPLRFVRRGNRKRGDQTDAAAARDGADRAVVETRLRKMSRHLMAVDYRNDVRAPCATLTLKKVGPDAQATFHAFCEDSVRILAKVTRNPPKGASPAFVFLLRVDVITSDGDGARRTQDTLALEMAIAADAVGHILADDGRPAVSALLRQAQIRSHDPIGREMVRAFCCCERYQGFNGLSPSSTFCSRVLQP
ncbi:hypothetical protein [Stenotrophomonas sp. GZD-301]|uniref:hypothetical protein n=1 Tax=Stenotrophomonas sp. GZD-301 TaxID=3404814 RepID=UPI003BB49D83